MPDDNSAATDPFSDPAGDSACESAPGSASDSAHGEVHGPKHSAPEAWPETAEALMRSRFEAFRHEDAAWLLASWHPRTRPAELQFDPEVRWRGLQIVDTVAGGPDDAEGIVEFRATYMAGGERGVQHERSRFVRDQARWVYLDGEMRD